MGRKKKDDKKQTITVGIEESVVKIHGSEEKLQQFLYKSAHEKAEKIKENDKH